MKIMYCPVRDVLRILFRDAPIETVDHHKTGLVLDYDQHGVLVGLEVPGASCLMAHPDQWEVVPPVASREANGEEEMEGAAIGAASSW